ncbi:hypothetical protein D3C80_1952460 [compost metagenome]
MQHGLVADRNLVAQGQRAARVGVQHRALLDIGVMPHRDRLVVAADHDTGPGTGAGLEGHVADDGGFRGHVGFAVDIGLDVAELVKRHEVSCTKGLC